ncbi:hypothetical protein SPONL_398 [uncultured Candidatus Thioglobus sp.]|nr:hypothetical protein SPONL_398 [uncultured Candidatus Thioglobus sp.]
MKFNLLGKISVIMVSLALLASCGTAPVRNVNSAAFSDNSSIANIEAAIIRAGSGLGWVMSKKSDGHILGRLALRSHLAIIDITYNKNNYSIKYKNSENLNYDGTNIHTNYNGWIQNLQKAIGVQMSIL